MKLTVFWDESVRLWIGVVESESHGQLKACRHLFGPEPSDPQICEFVRTRLPRLLERAGEGVPAVQEARQKVNPKRLHRLAAQELARRGPSSVAQEAMKRDLENRKQLRKRLSRQEREEQEQRRYELRRCKAKQKHRGR